VSRARRGAAWTTAGVPGRRPNPPANRKAAPKGAARSDPEGTAVSDIDGYLDELFDRLSGQGGAGRRMLDEASDHLRMAAAAKVAAGMPADRAEREAVAQFGATDRIAGLLHDVHHRPRLVTVASGAALVGGWALLMLAGSYLAAALGLAVWGRSGTIMHQTGAAGALMLLAGGALLAVRAGALPPIRPPYARFAAATLALGGIAVFVDLPLAVGLLFQQEGLWRHAAALVTGLALVNWLAFGAAHLARAARRVAPAVARDGTPL